MMLTNQLFGHSKCLATLGFQTSEMCRTTRDATHLGSVRNEPKIVNSNPPGFNAKLNMAKLYNCLEMPSLVTNFQGELLEANKGSSIIVAHIENSTPIAAAQALSSANRQYAAVDGNALSKKHLQSNSPVCGSIGGLKSRDVSPSCFPS